MKNKIRYLTLVLILFSFSNSNFLWADEPCVNYQGHLDVDGENYTGTASFKVSICDTDNTAIWSNDGSASNCDTQPTESFDTEVMDGVFSIKLGCDGLTDAIPSSLFETLNGPYEFHVWVKDEIATSFQKLSPNITIGHSLLALRAETLQGYVPSDFVLAGSGQINSEQLASGAITPEKLGSGSTWNFGTGSDGTVTLKAALGSTNNPAIRYNSTSDEWEYSNDGVSYSAMGSGGGGSGDITSVVAGAGLTTGGTSGDVTLDVGAGTGISVSANAVGLSYSDLIGSDPALSAGQSVFGTTGLIFEGTTADSVEGLLTVADPTIADKTWTLPNTTGTLITTGDTGTVTSTMISDNAITENDLAATLTLGSGDLLDLSASIGIGKGLRLPQDTSAPLGGTEGLILWDSDDNLLKVYDGASWATINNPAGAPTDATYLTLSTNGSLSDERTLAVGHGLTLTDGGAGSAATLGFTFSSTTALDPALNASESSFGTNGIIFEGSTADTIEGLLTVNDPTSSDKTWALPDASGTIALTTSDITGNASTASALFGDPSDCGAGEYATAIDDHGNLTCGAVSSGVAAGASPTWTGQHTFTKDPAGGATNNATILVNPATSAANEYFLAIQDNGTDRFSVDKEGDTSISGNLAAPGFIFLGDGLGTGLPSTTATITSGGQLVTPTKSVIFLDSDDSVAANRIFTLPNPNSTGQILIIVLKSVLNQVKLENSGNTHLHGDWSPDSIGDSIILMGYGTSYWIEISRTDLT